MHNELKQNHQTYEDEAELKFLFLRMDEFVQDFFENYTSLWTTGTPSWRPIPLPKGAIEVFTGFVLQAQVLVSVPVNFFILYLIAVNPTLRKTSVYVIIFSIGLGELAFLGPFVCGNMYYFFIGRNDTICALSAFVDSLICAGSPAFYAVLAINRYTAFFHEDFFRRWFTARNTIFILLGTSVIIIIGVLPLWPYMGYEVCHFCGLNAAESKFATWYSAIGLGSEAVYAIAILLYCNLKISRKLREHRNNIQSRGTRQKAVQMEALENITRLLYFHAFVMPWFALPGIFARFIPGVENVPWVGRIVGLLVSMEPCVTPYLIIHWMRPLNEAARAFFRRFGIIKIRRVRVAASFDATSQIAQRQSFSSTLVSTLADNVE